MANLEEEYAEAQQESADAEKAHARALKERDAELISAREKTEANSMAGSESEAAIEAIRAELKESRAELDRSHEQLEKAAESAESLTRQLAELHSDRDAVKAKFKEKIEKLEKQLHKRSKASEETEARVTELTEKLEQQSREHGKGSEDTEASEDAEAKVRELTEKLEQQAHEHDKDSEDAEARVQELTEELEKQAHKHDEDSEDARARLAELTEKLAAAESRDTSSDEDTLVADNADLQAEVQKLEGMVRDRTEQLNKVRWRQQMQEQQAQVSGQSDDKMMVVLNQQLTASRDDNQRLIEQIRQLEARLDSAGSSADDLTRIRGVGPKLVAQLNELGISQFDQIAALEHEDLEDENHPLHSFRGRIVKDEWIFQALELGA